MHCGLYITFIHKSFHFIRKGDIFLGCYILNLSLASIGLDLKNPLVSDGQSGVYSGRNSRMQVNTWFEFLAFVLRAPAGSI